MNARVAREIFRYRRRRHVGNREAGETGLVEPELAEIRREDQEAVRRELQQRRADQLEPDVESPVISCLPVSRELAEEAPGDLIDPDVLFPDLTTGKRGDGC